MEKGTQVCSPCSRLGNRPGRGLRGGADSDFSSYPSLNPWKYWPRARNHFQEEGAVALPLGAVLFHLFCTHGNAVRLAWTGPGAGGTSVPMPSRSFSHRERRIWRLAHGQACFPPTETKQTTDVRSSLPLAFFTLPVEPTEGTWGRPVPPRGSSSLWFTASWACSRKC